MARAIIDFPAPDSPTRPRTSPGAMARLTPRRSGSGRAAADGDVEVVDLESGGHRRCTGSKVARRPSPRRLKPSTVTMMQPIGRASSHGTW